jgi:hypothetical protein
LTPKLSSAFVKSTCALEEHCVNRGPDAQTEALISEQEHDKAWAMPGGLESCPYQKLHLARKSLKLTGSAASFPLP